MASHTLMPRSLANIANSFDHCNVEPHELCLRARRNIAPRCEGGGQLVGRDVLYIRLGGDKVIDTRPVYLEAHDIVAYEDRPHC